MRAEVRPFIASSWRGVYFPFHMLRLFTALFVAFAMFLSPVMMANGGGAAMAQTKAAEHGHCEGKGAPASDEKSEAKLSCASSCAAFPAVQPLVIEAQRTERALPVSSRLAVLNDIFPERETPPPRSSPAI